MSTTSRRRQLNQWIIGGFLVLLLTVGDPYLIGHVLWENAHPDPRILQYVAARPWWGEYLPSIAFGAPVLLAVFGAALLLPPYLGRTGLRVLVAVLAIAAGFAAPKAAASAQDFVYQSTATAWASTAISAARIPGGACGVPVSLPSTTGPPTSFVLAERNPADETSCTQLRRYRAWKPVWTTNLGSRVGATQLALYSKRGLVVLRLAEPDGTAQLQAFKTSTGKSAWVFNCPRKSKGYPKIQAYSGAVNGGPTADEAISVLCGSRQLTLSPHTGRQISAP